jgi:hypothetical protein
MARINIEDSIYRDNRFLKLMFHFGSKWTAIGAVVDAWRIAQDFFSPENPRALIPIEEWKMRGGPEELLTFNLAVMEGDCIYVRGAEEQFKWIMKQWINGRKGGRPKKPMGSVGIPTGNPRNPSSSSSCSEEIYKGKFDFEEVDKIYPRKEGFEDALPMLHEQIKTQEDFDALLLAVRNYTENCRVTKKAPQYILSLPGFLQKKWRGWARPNAGKIIMPPPQTMKKDIVSPGDWPDGKGEVLNLNPELIEKRNKIIKRKEKNEREESETT